MIKKCHQRIIRDKLKQKENGSVIDNYDTIKVKEISRKEAEELVLKYEWLKTLPDSTFIHYGLFFDDTLTATECFTKNRAGGRYTLYNKPAVSLTRGCCAYWAPPWTSSYLISKSLKLLNKKFNGKAMYVLAYSDWDAGEIGTVYQASNWFYLGHKYKYEWISPDGIRYDRNTHRNKARYIDPDFKKNKKINPKYVKQVKKEMINNGWTKSKTMRGRYATVIGNKGKYKSELIKILKEKSVEYPKRNDNNE